MKITILLILVAVLTLATALAQESNGQAPEAKGNEATGSFGDIPELEEAFITTSPSKRDDGILVGELGTDGGNKTMILQLAQEVAEGKHGNFDSYLIAHKGKLLFESYYRRGRVNLPHPQASATKSYTSLALGRAIQLGHLTMADLHKPIIGFLKDLDPSKLVAGAEKITLHEALTMRSGIQLSPEQREALEKDPSQLKDQGQVQAFLEHSEPITEASQAFVYKDDPRLVMQVIDAVVPGTAKDFIKKELLDKMGITNYNWETDISGLPSSGNGTSMTSRDMIKWGTLALNKGKWNGEQLVPEVFVAKSTSKIVDQSEEYDDPARGVSGTAYGYFWWQADFSSGDKSFLAKSARGGSGQNIYVIEELDLVVVTTTHRPVDGSVEVTAEKVIPAFIHSLKDLYFGQKPPGLVPEVFAPDIVKNAHGVSFSPDLDEIYFSASKEDEDASIYFSKLQENEWTPIQKANFTNGGKKEELYPFVSLIDERIYFTAFDSIFSDEKIWYVDRLEDSWSDARQLDSPINDDIVFYINQSKNGDLFYTSISNGKMYRATNQNDAFPEVQKLELEFGHHGFISPSQEYLIAYARNQEDEKRKDFDLYVCFKANDGTWTKPINLGEEVNTKAHEGVPSITPDGKYLFFDRSEEGEDGNIYWVSTEVIHKLKPVEFSTREQSYFGQKPPGLIPEVFAPGIVSINGRFEGGISFSPDLQEMYFGADDENDKTQIYYSKLQDNQWTPIKRANFSKGKKNEEMHPFVSPDGKRIYFTALDNAFTDEKIWYLNRSEASWSEASLLESPINDDLVFYPNQSRNGDLYYFNLTQFKVYHAPNSNGAFPEASALEIEFGHHGFIAPSQDYLLVTDRNKEDKTRKDNDVYVYFKNQDGTWTKPINLGESVNTDWNEKSPSITPDGKYLFFGRDERNIEPGLSNIYWVDARFIQDLRPKN